MIKMTASDLRDIVAELIKNSIELHRNSKLIKDENYNESYDYDYNFDYAMENEDVSDDEIDEFLLSNQLLDINTVEQLVDPGFLGFSSKNVNVNKKWLDEFKSNISSWASTNAWLGADEPIMPYIMRFEANESQIWTPKDSSKPIWINNSPSCLLLAADLLKSGRLLSEMDWRKFEELIGLLLEDEGWKVEVTKATRDGGIDVIALKHDKILGEIKTIWQAKKYSMKNKVKLSEVRELTAIRDEVKASKAHIVTTSHLSKDAIEWIKRDIYRLGYKDNDQLERWVKDAAFGRDK